MTANPETVLNGSYNQVVEGGKSSTDLAQLVFWQLTNLHAWLNKLFVAETTSVQPILMNLEVNIYIFFCLRFFILNNSMETGFINV